MTMRVLSAEDLLVSKLMAMTEHSINYRELPRDRALAPRADRLRRRARRGPQASPFGRAFFVIAEGLEIV